MRKVQTYTITKEGRDRGKVFKITEMAAIPGHKWATRAIFALMNAGVEIPEDIADAGFATLATLGIKALGKVNIEVAEPLLQELMSCVEIIPDPAKPEIVRRCIDEDFEEISTLFILQKEVLALHLDFFTAGGR